MKQTAVELLVDKLIELGYLHSVDYGQSPKIKEVINQAKEMEKEQIIDAFVECWKENMPEGYECKQSAEYYYNETYGGQE
jgi:HEPN domain-containing protein